MTITPMDIQRRPFSVEPFTKVMLPDGIFDTAIRKQLITCFYTNTSDVLLKDVSIYLEGIGDPGIVPEAHSYLFSEIKPGSSVRVSWLASFEHGTPGKKIVSFIAQAQSMSIVRTLKNIFVSQTERDSVTGEYRCRVEEGTMRISKFEVIGPRDKWHPCSDRYQDCRPTQGPWVPSNISVTFYPNPSYTGVHGDLPFSDPWWKILAWVIAAIAAVVAIISEVLGEGTASTAVSGTFDETTDDIDCCAPDPGGVPGDDAITVAGVASVIATAAVAVGLRDDADPYWRGQEATLPTNGELTVSETVEATFKYPEGAPQTGKPYPVYVDWKYQRNTDKNTYTHSVQETQRNIHVNGGVEVDVPAVHRAFRGPFIIKARFKNGEGLLFTGQDLYAFALLRSPDNMYFFVDLVDDGLEYDKNPNDGTYTGTINFEEIYRKLLEKKMKLEGVWRAYVFAQDVNDATPDMLPVEAAKRVGGAMIASGLQLRFDPSLPCPLEAQASFTVIE